MTEKLKDQKAPLVLAGVDFLLPIYREASDHPDVLDEGVEGSPEASSPEELRDRAWEVVRPRFEEARREALARHARLAGTGQAPDGLVEIVPAAYFGRVETLLVARGSRRWGFFDPASGLAHEHGEPERGDGDLVDFAAVQTFLNGGAVHVLDPEKVPAGARPPRSSGIERPVGQEGRSPSCPRRRPRRVERDGLPCDGGGYVGKASAEAAERGNRTRVFGRGSPKGRGPTSVECAFG